MGLHAVGLPVVGLRVEGFDVVGALSLADSRLGIQTWENPWEDPEVDLFVVGSLVGIWLGLDVGLRVVGMADPDVIGGPGVVGCLESLSVVGFDVGVVGRLLS